MTAMLGLIFVALEAADAALTFWAVQHGFTEINTLYAPVAGSWIGPAIKILPALAVAWGLWRLTARWPGLTRAANIGLIMVIAFMGLILVSNLLEL